MACDHQELEKQGSAQPAEGARSRPHLTSDVRPPDRRGSISIISRHQPVVLVMTPLGKEDRKGWGAVGTSRPSVSPGTNCATHHRSALGGPRGPSTGIWLLIENFHPLPEGHVSWHYGWVQPLPSRETGQAQGSRQARVQGLHEPLFWTFKWPDQQVDSQPSIC